MAQNSRFQLQIYIPENITLINQTKAINSVTVEAMKISRSRITNRIQSASNHNSFHDLKK